MNIKKAVSTPLILLVLAVLCSGVAATIADNSFDNLEYVNNVGQAAISLQNKDGGTYESITPPNPEKDAHYHNWQLVKKEIMNSTQCKQTYLCLTDNCPVMTEVRYVDGNFGVDVNVQNGYYNFINNNFVEINEYIRASYYLNSNYVVSFDYEVITKPSNVDYTDFGFKIALWDTGHTAYKLQSDTTYFTGKSGHLTYSFKTTDSNIQIDFPILGYSLYCNNNVEASIKITNFQVYVEEDQHVHSLTDWVVIQEATCSSEGYQIRNCELDDCAFFESEVLPMRTHSIFRKTISETTCQIKGEVQNICLVCGFIENVVSEEYGPHNSSYTVIQDSTACNVQGTYSYICKVCHAVVSSGSFYAPCDYEVEIVEPTCTTKGNKKETCKVCHKVVNTELDYAHSYATRITEATCTVPAYAETYCTKCEEVTNSEFHSAKAPHNYGLLNFKIEYYPPEGIDTTVYYYQCSGCDVIFKTSTNYGTGFSSDKTSEETSLYTFLSYLKSTGTQYINTGVVPNQNTKIEIEMSALDVSNGKFKPYGSAQALKDKSFECYSWSNKLQFNYGNTGGTTVISQEIANNDRIKIIHDKNNITATIRGIEYTGSYGAQSFTSPNNLVLFATNRGSISYGGQMKLYSCKIYDNGNLVRDFVPALRNEDNVVGLYDKVNGTFYQNSGTGLFGYN